MVECIPGNVKRRGERNLPVKQYPHLFLRRYGDVVIVHHPEDKEFINLITEDIIDRIPGSKVKSNPSLDTPGEIVIEGLGPDENIREFITRAKLKMDKSIEIISGDGPEEKDITII